MKKAFAVKDRNGQINGVYFLDNGEDLVEKENTFSPNEWNRGIAKWQFEVDTKKAMGDEYELVGNLSQDIGPGWLYTLYFVKKDKFMRRNANDIIEEFIRKWEMEEDEK